ncbi:box C/D snoRNA protein 1-like isoform X1 [Biomphalaria pfeifferi]|uniref:Box C/D snoRNA protein 1-like isoform X1 n=1 Tax=Biomphalaria pfeifferi TaxID=112525 RepID=A0AAD8B8N1_BIOPF|nr:box C/D snoRNA protein 1-like isoform X1 [Biomphalaria pfeifferi]
MSETTATVDDKVSGTDLDLVQVVVDTRTLEVEEAVGVAAVPDLVLVENHEKENGFVNQVDAVNVFNCVSVNNSINTNSELNETESNVSMTMGVSVSMLSEAQTEETQTLETDKKDNTVLGIDLVVDSQDNGSVNQVDAENVINSENISVNNSVNTKSDLNETESTVPIAMAVSISRLSEAQTEETQTLETDKKDNTVLGIDLVVDSQDNGSVNQVDAENVINSENVSVNTKSDLNETESTVPIAMAVSISRLSEAQTEETQTLETGKKDNEDDRSNPRSNTDRSNCSEIEDDCVIELVETSEKAVKNNCLKRKFPCEICNQTEAIYTCPCCELRTCSLPCVKEHKIRLGCSGERLKTAFVDKSQYGEGHLLNDYRLLEDANRKLYSFKSSQDNRKNHSFSGPYMNKRTKLLSTAAFKRGIKLQVLSQALTRHKNNTSYYMIRSDKILWHIGWHFVASNTEIKDERVPEDTILKDIAKKWINFVDHPEMRKCLRDYEKDNLEASQFLLKIECLPANRVRFFKLNPNATLGDNLKGHCLTEFPTIYVLPPQYKDTQNFVLISEDDLEFMEVLNRQHLKPLVATTSQTDLELQLLNPKSEIYMPEIGDGLER